jgi:hypothetical protein
MVRGMCAHFTLISVNKLYLKRLILRLRSCDGVRKISVLVVHHRYCVVRGGNHMGGMGNLKGSVGKFKVRLYRCCMMFLYTGLEISAFSTVKENVLFNNSEIFRIA